MSDTVRLSSRLGKDEATNGLDSLADDLIDDPDQVVCVVAWLKVQKITHDVETHADVPTVLVKRIEPIGAPEDVPPEITELVLRKGEMRTGKTPLPMEVVEVIEGGYVVPGRRTDEDDEDDEADDEPEDDDEYDLADDYEDDPDAEEFDIREVVDVPLPEVVGPVSR